MKAISVRNPWPYALLHLGKTIENRTWYSDYRGPLLIHASKSCTRSEYAEAVWWMAHRSLANPRGIPSFEELPKGGIVGVCRMVDCVRESSSPWFEGPWGFVLEGVTPVEFHACKGSLGLFDVEWPPLKAVKPEEKGTLL